MACEFPVAVRLSCCYLLYTVYFTLLYFTYCFFLLFIVFNLMSYAQIFISADITVAHNNVCRCSCPFFGALPPSGPPCEGLISDWGPCRSRVLISLVFTLSSTCHFSLSLVYTSAIYPSFIHSVFTPDSPTTSFTTLSSRPVAIDALIFPPDFSRCSLASFQYLVSVSFFVHN